MFSDGQSSEETCCASTVRFCRSLPTLEETLKFRELYIGCWSNWGKIDAVQSSGQGSK